MRILFTSILIVQLCFCSLNAQSYNSYEFITTIDGLPNSKITSLLQSPNGLIWVGTESGFCVYDGYTFFIQKSVPYNANTLRNDNIKNIAQDRNDNIWFLTRFGGEYLNIENNIITSLLKFPENSKPNILLSDKNSDFVLYIFNDSILKVNINSLYFETIELKSSLKFISADYKDNELCLLSKNGILKYNSETNEQFLYKKNKVLSESNGDILIYDKKNIIYSEGNKVFLQNLANNSINLLLQVDQPIMHFSGIKENIFSISTKTHVYQIELDKFFNVEKSKSVFSDNKVEIYNLIEDNEHLIWVATNKGMVKINPFSDRIKHFSKLRQYFNQQGNVVVESNRKGIITQNHSGELYFTNSIKGKKIKLPVKECNSICSYEDKFILIGTNKGLQKFNIFSGSINDINYFDNHKILKIKIIDDQIWVATNKGLYKQDDKDFCLICNDVISDFIIHEEKIIYVSSETLGIKTVDSCMLQIGSDVEDKLKAFKIRSILETYDGSVWLATNYGLYRLNLNFSSIHEFLVPIYNENIAALVEAEASPEIWFSTRQGIGAFNYQNNQLMFFGFDDGIKESSFIKDAGFLTSSGQMAFLSLDELVFFHPDSVFRNSSPPEVIISFADFYSKRSSYHKIRYSSDTITITPDIQYFKLSLSTQSLFSPQKTTYKYSLEEINKEPVWQSLVGNEVLVGNITPGIYKLKIKANNSHGIESLKDKEHIIIVKAPIFFTKIAFLVYGVFLTLLIFLIINFRTRNLRRMNREYKEKERIAKKIEQQKEELSVKNKNITDSINYARRIQLAMMPSVRMFSTLFKDSFILHMPKDIVSGDFYWINHVRDKIFFSAVDCTGHGVPGAFMSIIGVELFRRITEIEKIYTPAEVLNSLSKNFERVFADVEEMKLRDGMDLAFCSLNEDHTVLEYAGAFNPLYIIRDSSIIEIKGDRHSVGVYEEEEEPRSFNNHTIPLQDEDIIYIFTDGFVDQFGGPEGKKYKYRRFRHLLLALHQLPMEKQKEFLKKSIMEWRGELDQVDDILVMGLRIHQEKS